MPTLTSGPLGSLNYRGIGVEGTQAGWAAVTFSGNNASQVGIVSLPGSSINLATGGAPVAGPNTFFGLPVVGFMVRSFVNGTIPATAPATGSVLSAYSSAFDHSFRQRITPP